MFGLKKLHKFCFKKYKILLASLIIALVLSQNPVWAEEVIVFVAGAGEDRSIMMVGAEGGEPVLLADWPGADTQPSVGPEGQLSWINHDGQSWNLIEDGRMVSRGRLHLSPTYAPDGTLVAAMSGVESTDLYIFSHKKKPRKLISGAGGLAVSPSFSPDGKILAYVANHEDKAQIFIAPASGGTATLLTDSEDAGTDPVWSPSGEFLAYVCAGTDICLISSKGEQGSQLTRDKGINRRPSFSPDGQRLVFVNTAEDGISRLVIKNLKNSEEHILMPDFTLPQNMPTWASKMPGTVIKRGP